MVFTPPTAPTPVGAEGAAWMPATPLDPLVRLAFTEGLADVVAAGGSREPLGPAGVVAGGTPAGVGGGVVAVATGWEAAALVGAVRATDAAPAAGAARPDGAGR
ncbi:hypothetical protein AB0J72_41480 [Dactylosporangium sp. NPDC049742]|uniref:hypothetical protein n=1 Tax=Dactylosporangium sp. NPDC049742 TaxID=3154737 RepID=UPI00341342C5